MDHAYSGLFDAAPQARPGLRERLQAGRAARIAASPSRRRRLAEDVEHVVARAEHRSGRLTAEVPVSREAVRQAEPALLDLGERLRAARPVDPEGVRLVRALLVDGSGPLYLADDPADLRIAAERALAALDGHGGGA
jgi:hypothetical protein